MSSGTGRNHERNATWTSQQNTGYAGAHQGIHALCAQLRLLLAQHTAGHSQPLRTHRTVVPRPAHTGIEQYTQRDASRPNTEVHEYLVCTVMTIVNSTPTKDNKQSRPSSMPPCMPQNGRRVGRAQVIQLLTNSRRSTAMLDG